ncbi:YdeI (YjbR/CyaY-like superfamily) [Ensifer sp. WSM1721]|uniref:YdeI/OmpD-associated family protein n=1 Tax=Ensifer sp. WSM1721 TaxID=1041159 RepID=UPI00047E8BEC
MSEKENQLPIIHFGDTKAFEDWLARQGPDCRGLWVKFAKKASGIASITPKEALDVALCHGWIDGQRIGLDDKYYLNKYTPRRARSRWSEINRTRALELIAEGRMTPRGMAEVERARADGRWEAAAAPPSKATVPEDLQDALKHNGAAKALFDELDSRNRYAVLFRIQDAKKAETRKARIEKYVDMLARGETPYPRGKGRLQRKS